MHEEIVGDIIDLYNSIDYGLALSGAAQIPH